jgi:hypothetical protein
MKRLSRFKFTDRPDNAYILLSKKFFLDSEVIGETEVLIIGADNYLFPKSFRRADGESRAVGSHGTTPSRTPL